MENKQKLVPNIWCNRSAEAVAALYEEAFGAAGFEVSSVVEARYPETDLPDFQKEFAGQPVTINVTINIRSRIVFLFLLQQIQQRPSLHQLLHKSPYPTKPTKPWLAFKLNHPFEQYTNLRTPSSFF